MSQRSTKDARTAIARRQSVTPDREAIARVAYELYLHRGKEPGHDLQDWFAAERLLQQEGKRRVQQTRTRGTRALPERRKTTR